MTSENITIRIHSRDVAWLGRTLNNTAVQCHLYPEIRTFECAEDLASDIQKRIRGNIRKTRKDFDLDCNVEVRCFRGTGKNDALTQGSFGHKR